jgi:hypothetical protein
MSDEYVDPSGTTDQFRAFVQDGAQEPAATRSRTPLIVAVGVAAVIVAVVVFLAVR